MPLSSLFSLLTRIPTAAKQQGKGITRAGVDRDSMGRPEEGARLLYCRVFTAIVMAIPTSRGKGATTQQNYCQQENGDDGGRLHCWVDLCGFVSKRPSVVCVRVCCMARFWLVCTESICCQHSTAATTILSQHCAHGVRPSMQSRNHPNMFFEREAREGIANWRPGCKCLKWLFTKKYLYFILMY